MEFMFTHTHTHTQVKGISGPNRGLIGTLINIDEGDGIVKLDVDAALKIISLDQLAKYVPRRWVITLLKTPTGSNLWTL